MHLDIKKNELEYLLKIIKLFISKCRAKSLTLFLSFSEEYTRLSYSSEDFFLIYKHPQIAEFKGSYGVSLDFIKNIVTIFDDDIVEIDFQDSLVIAHQGDVTLKDNIMTTSKGDTFRINEDELEELPIEFNLSNKLLTLDVEEMGFENKDPYRQLYNISKDRLIKMSSFCALLQKLEKEAKCEMTLTQDILSMCSIMRNTAQYYKYQNSFYVRDEKLEIKMPLANVRFPAIDMVLNNIKKGSENLLIQSDGLLDICEKCCNLSLKNKLNRVDIMFNEGLMMYSYNNVLTGSISSGLDIEWKASFNPLLMRGILKYINEECVIICKNQGNNIIIHNMDDTITFMLALCR